MQATEMTKFVETLELPPVTIFHAERPRVVPMLTAAPPTLDGIVTASPEKNSGFVDGGSLVSFVAGVSSQNQADVLNSTLLAQLAANKKYNREKDTESWYGFYRNVLENVGWVVQAFSFQHADVSGASATVDKIIVELLAALATGNEIAAISATINAIKNLPTADNRFVLFDHASHSNNNGNFQIGTCAESDGRVAMKMGAFYFSSVQNVDKVLWFNFSSSNTKLYSASQAMTLDSDIYSQVRASIVTKLGNNAKSFVADLDI